MARLRDYIAQEYALSVSGAHVTVARTGMRAVLKDEHQGYSLGRHLSGQLRYHYRNVDAIAADFAAGHSALEAVLAIAAATA